jgi:hypothetical protein
VWFGAVDRFVPPPVGAHSICARKDCPAKAGGYGIRPYTFKIYLQSHRCKGILDRFERPHRFKSNAKRKYKIAQSFQWTDPNYRKPNTDLLKTKKKPSSWLLFYIIKINTFFICVVVFSSFICYN